jgi:hypothetical protein
MECVGAKVEPKHMYSHGLLGPWAPLLVIGLLVVVSYVAPKIMKHFDLKLNEDRWFYTVFVLFSCVYGMDVGTTVHLLNIGNLHSMPPGIIDILNLGIPTFIAGAISVAICFALREAIRFVELRRSRRSQSEPGKRAKTE